MSTTKEDPTEEFRENYRNGVDYNEPHQLWLGVADSYHFEGSGTSIYSYVDAVQDKLYIPPDGDTSVPLRGFSLQDWIEVYLRGINIKNKDHRWDCGFEPSPEGLVVPESSLEHKI